MPFPCDRKDCPQEAVGLLCINVPAKGGSANIGECIRCVTQLKLCAQHLNETKAQDFLAADPKWKGNLLQICQSRNLAPPDFDRAFCSGQEFDHGSW